MKLLQLSALECSSFRIPCLVTCMPFGIIALKNINNSNLKSVYHWIITTEWYANSLSRANLPQRCSHSRLAVPFGSIFATMQPLPKGTPKYRHHPHRMGTEFCRLTRMNKWQKFHITTGNSNIMEQTILVK